MLSKAVSLFLLIAFINNAIAQRLILDPTIPDAGILLIQDEVFDTCESGHYHSYANFSNAQRLTIEGGLIASLTLTCLLFENVGISSLNDRIYTSLPNLKLLNLAKNRFFEIYWDLNVANNTIKVINETAFTESLLLESLDLSHNKIASIPPRLFDPLDQLKSLTLSNNLLTEVPFGISVSNLKHLSLSFNNISELPKGTFATFPALNKLSLRHNNIGSVNLETFKELTHLEELDLADNQISVLPTGWMEIVNRLRYFNLNFNLISNIDDLYLEKRETDFWLNLHVKNNSLEPISGPGLRIKVNLYVGNVIRKSDY